MKIPLLLLGALLISAHIADEQKDQIKSDLLNSDKTLETSPTKVASKEDLRNSYNQMMSLESNPEERSKMDKMMEKLAGITVDSDTSTDLKPTVEKKTELKTSKGSEDDRKLVSDDPIMQMNKNSNEDRNLNVTPTTDDSVSPDMGSSGSFGEDFQNIPSNSESGRKLNTGGLMDTGMGGSGVNMDFANMKNSYDNLHSEAPGTGELDMDTGSDDFNGIDSGMHQSATNAMINRFDQTNQQRMAKLNTMFPPIASSLPSKKRHRKSKIINIKNMLKNYPPGLVDEFMPELKDKVMKKFNSMRKRKNEDRKIRRLKRQLHREKQREIKRRKLKQRRRRAMIKKRQRRKLRQRHHHKHHHHSHFKPHFSMKAKKKQRMNHQYHTLKVVNNFMHNRGNQLHHAHHNHHNHHNHHHHHYHHLRERRLEDNKSEKPEDDFLNLEEAVKNQIDNTPNSEGKKLI